MSSGPAPPATVGAVRQPSYLHHSKPPPCSTRRIWRRSGPSESAERTRPSPRSRNGSSVSSAQRSCSDRISARSSSSNMGVAWDGAGMKVGVPRRPRRGSRPRRRGRSRASRPLWSLALGSAVDLDPVVILPAVPSVRLPIEPGRGATPVPGAARSSPPADGVRSRPPGCLRWTRGRPRVRSLPSPARRAPRGR